MSSGLALREQVVDTWGVKVSTWGDIWRHRFCDIFCDKFATDLRHFCDMNSGSWSWRSKKLHFRAGDKIKFGGADRTRTDHLSNANAALYQMSYYPVRFIILQNLAGEAHEVP